MRNCAEQKHKNTLQNTDKEANLPLSSNVQTLKCCQLQGVFAPWPPGQGLCPWTPLGALPQTPVIGSRSALAINVSTCAVQNFPYNKPCLVTAGGVTSHKAQHPTPLRHTSSQESEHPPLQAWRHLWTTPKHNKKTKAEIRWTCLLFLRTCRMELSAEWPSGDNWH